ncbi:hypothetical protein MMC08_007613 [Hypocenomyce scalaris]|nr:hypothetical protein [Hypocenomyce scalaris]
MPSPPRNLDTLPVELIQRTAAAGPCESALALLKVNRSLYHACNDQLVFKSIMNNANGSSNKLPTWHSIVLSCGVSTLSWARYALADSKARHMARDAVDTSNGIPDDFASWAPQLMASHHPLVDYASVPDLLFSLYSTTEAPPFVLVALSFCLAARLLSPNQSNPALPQPPGAAPHQTPLEQFLYDSPSASLVAPAHAIFLTATHTHANQAVGFFASALRVALARNHIRFAGSPSPPPFPPPTTRAIPFLSFMHPRHHFYPARRSNLLPATCAA